MYPGAGGCGGGDENGGRYRPPRDPGRPRHIPMPYRPKPCRPICLELYRCPIVAQYSSYRASNYCMYRAADPYDYYHVYLCHHGMTPDHYACRCCLGYGPVVDAFGYHHRYVRPAYVDCPSCYCEACTRVYYASVQHHAHPCPWVYAPQGHAVGAGAAPAQQQPNRYAAARAGQGAHTAAIPNSAFSRYYPGGNHSPPDNAPAPINNGAHYACPCRYMPVRPRGELSSETALRHAELSDGFQRRSPPAPAGAGPVPYNGTRPNAP